MRLLKLGLASLLWLLAAGFISFNQQDPESFSDDPATFVSQLNTYFESQNNRATQLILKDFIANWEAGKFTQPVQQEIIKTSNLFLKQRIRPHMGYKDYLNCLNSFTETAGNQSILEWHQAMVQFIDAKKLKEMNAFLTNTTRLNLDKVMYKSNVNSWQFRRGNINYHYDSTLSVVLKDIDIVCYSGRDSIIIKGTSGFLFPLSGRFEGKDGKVSWEKYGYNPQTVFSVLNTYKINLSQSTYKADTVNLYLKDYFSQPLIGSLEDRVLAGVPLDKSVYPRFVSYTNDIGIKNLYKNIDYYGGLSMEGSRILGTGNEFAEATVFIKKGDDVLMRLNSKTFVIRPDRLVSQRASAIIFHEADSIYHPGIQLRYIDESRELSLLRTGVGVAGSPFASSFHKVDMFVQGLYYTVGADSMSFEMLRGLNRKETALFESANFYSEDRFSDLQGIDEINPINVVYNYTKSNKVTTFFLSDLVQYMNKPFDQVKAMVINLSNGGFISYYIESDRIEVKQRLYDYLNARSKKMDYDVIQISSNVQKGANAVLNLKTFNIRVMGVDSVSLSDAQAVSIIPRNKEIIIGANRDIVFTGLVNAGYFSFYSNKSSFEYDKFKLNMPFIDSLSFKVDTVNSKTKHIDQVSVKNVIATLNGELLIDDPSNKSGIKKYPVYPLFNSTSDAFVFYDYYTIRGGAYKRNKFYYTVYPFTIDSLNSFTTEGLKFDGSLYSGTIMPVIEEPLRVMEDYSLGFARTLGPQGIPVYNEQGTFYSRVSLNNSGFHGNGKLEFMTSLSESDNFLFYPDSLVADLKSFTIKEKAGFPSYPLVYAEGVHQYWMPLLDVMKLQTLPGREFEMYGAKSFHTGKLSLTSAGLLGSGKSRLDNADILSNFFNFRDQSFSTDTTDFKLYYPERPVLSLMTRVNAGNVDFQNKRAKFGIPGQSQKIELPLSKYYCYMDQIEWGMEQSELHLTNSLVKRAELSDTADFKQLVDFDFSGSEFISTDPARDSLQFFAMEATYKMMENIINAREVKMIRVADIAIFPGDSKVTILSDGAMQPLEGATIIANRKDKYHRLYDVSVKVNSRNHYIASGYLDYVDVAGNIQPLFFNPVTVDSAFTSYGLASVKPGKVLPLNDHFKFTGDIKLVAERKDLFFNGLFLMQNSCLTQDLPWVRFSSELNPQDIRIPINLNERDSINAPLLFGVVYSDFFASIYPSMFERPKAWGDTLLIGTTGFIRYDANNDVYFAGSNQRLNNESKAGNLLTFSTDQCVLTAEGALNIGTSLGSVNVQAYGKVKQFTLVDSTRFNMALAVDFFFSPQAMTRMRENIQTVELPSVDVNSVSFNNMLVNLLGEQAGNEFLQELNLTGQIKKMPAALDKRIIFNDVNMVWDGKLKSFVSDGKLGITTIQGDFVNRSVNGYIEIGKRRTGDILNMYLELSPTDWYFFSYGSGYMQAISSNNEFNTIIASLKENKRTLNTKDDIGYQFIISTPEARMAFLRKMQMHNSGETNTETGGE